MKHHFIPDPAALAPSPASQPLPSDGFLPRRGNRIAYLISVASAAAIGLALASCGPHQDSPVSLPAIAIGGIDTSQSAREHLPQFVRSISRLSGILSPKRDRVVMFRVDSRCAEVYDGSAHGSSERALRAFVPPLSEEARGRGSRADAFWKAAACKVAADRSQAAIAVALATDGYADGVGEEGHAEIRAAAKRLAADPRVRIVAVIGVSTGTREEIRRDLAPLGARLAFLDAASAPATIHRALKGGRP